MRIHTDSLTPRNVHETLMGLPGVYAEVAEHGSRSKHHALEVRLTGTSPYRTMDGEDQAATWDEWGVVMRRLFNLDPDMVIGNNSKNFETRAGFELRTGDRFDDALVPADTHPRHRWESVAPYRFECSKCSATFNYA